MNREQSSYLLSDNNKDGNYLWTYYSVSRVIEVTAWQSVNAVCHCCLTHSSCHWTHLFWLQ